MHPTGPMRTKTVFAVAVGKLNVLPGVADDLRDTVGCFGATTIVGLQKLLEAIDPFCLALSGEEKHLKKPT
jgi:hypothetical protein